MNLVGQLLHDEDVLLDVDVANKDELLKVIAHLLASRHGLAEAQVLESLRAREKLGSTALGQGVAIPHARMDQVREPAGVFVRTKQPIPFDAPDGKPVSKVLALLVPKEANMQHLQLLADAAGSFSDEALREGLGRCSQCEEARRLIAEWDEAAGRGDTPANARGT
ncbi:MAG TPA: PTS sugar transporter subunit IIA [Usitatibacter sp.]|nr:PTS sugar transporter subunit IIA [Usitatibacter sp.]